MYFESIFWVNYERINFPSFDNGRVNRHIHYLAIKIRMNNFVLKLGERKVR